MTFVVEIDPEEKGICSRCDENDGETFVWMAFDQGDMPDHVLDLLGPMPGVWVAVCTGCRTEEDVVKEG